MLRDRRAPGPKPSSHACHSQSHASAESLCSFKTTRRTKLPTIFSSEMSITPPARTSVTVSSSSGAASKSGARNANRRPRLAGALPGSQRYIAVIGLPDKKLISHEPQCPAWHDRRTCGLWASQASRMLMPAGTIILLPHRCSTTSNSRSPLRCATPVANRFTANGVPARATTASMSSNMVAGPQP